MMMFERSCSQFCCFSHGMSPLQWCTWFTHIVYTTHMAKSPLLTPRNHTCHGHWHTTTLQCNVCVVGSCAPLRNAARTRAGRCQTLLRHAASRRQTCAQRAALYNRSSGKPDSYARAALQDDVCKQGFLCILECLYVISGPIFHESGRACRRLGTRQRVLS